VARVLAGRPRLILADEPTGALDAGTAGRTVGLLRRSVLREDGALLPTHDEDLAAQLPARLQVRDGAAVEPSGAPR
jgi:ABC-type lipoprotein export system ATPase subunit